MINDTRAQEITDQLSAILGTEDMTDFLVIIPFTGRDTPAFISASAASAAAHNSMILGATLKTLVQNLMRFNGLTLEASAGALHAMVDAAAEESAEELQSAEPKSAWGGDIPSA